MFCVVVRFQDCLKGMSTPLWWLSVRKVHKEKDLCSTAVRSCTNGSLNRLVQEVVSLRLSYCQYKSYWNSSWNCTQNRLQWVNILNHLSVHRSWTTCMLFSLWIHLLKVWRAELLHLQPCSTGKLPKLETLKCNSSLLMQSYATQH